MRDGEGCRTSTTSAAPAGSSTVVVAQITIRVTMDPMAPRQSEATQADREIHSNTHKQTASATSASNGSNRSCPCAASDSAAPPTMTAKETMAMARYFAAATTRGATG